MVNPDTLLAGKGELKTVLTSIARQNQGLLKAVGIGTALAVAASLLIPDHAVMSKQELDDNTELSSAELMMRKSAVPLIVGSLLNAPRNLVSVARLLRAPGVETKVRATARAMASVPGWYAAFRVIQKRIENEEGTLNPRAIFDNPTHNKVVGAIGAAGTLMPSATETFMDLVREHGLPGRS